MILQQKCSSFIDKVCYFDVCYFYPVRSAGTNVNGSVAVHSCYDVQDHNTARGFVSCVWRARCMLGWAGPLRLMSYQLDAGVRGVAASAADCLAAGAGSMSRGGEESGLWSMDYGLAVAAVRLIAVAVASDLTRGTTLPTSHATRASLATAG